MKILIYSPVFYPSIGGLETIVSDLAHEFFNLGHEVKLVSQIPATDSKSFPFEVIRKPSWRKLLELTRWCDIYFQGCVSLKGILPLLIVPKPLVVSHQTWYSRLDGRLSWQDYLKLFATYFATNIAVSQAVAETLPAPSTVIPNSYSDEIFHQILESQRDKDLVFLGRLVSDKGADLLLQSLAKLKDMGLQPSLTIIGKGVEETQLRKQVKELKLDNQVTFVGIKVEHELAELLNRHKIMVVPSRWNEPFGIVALEGIACGCVVVGSEGGGLKDAIGSCGITFSNGNIDALTKILADLLTYPEKLLAYRKDTNKHLLRHQKKEVAKAYLRVMEAVV